MTKIYGKNTLQALSASLSELYVLRQSGSNSLPLYNLDNHLRDRPDWVIYRLVRERPRQAVLDLPPGYTGGTELLLTNLTRAANSSDPLIKWTVYGLLAFWMLRLTQIEEQFWHVRMPQKISSAHTPDSDRVYKRDIEKILKWMQNRQRKFGAAISNSTEISLKTWRERIPPREHLINVEQLILLALGNISIFLMSLRLKMENPQNAQEVFVNVANYINTANGGWNPGQAVLLTGLQHYRHGFMDNKFSSSFLPFDISDYYDWFAAATGKFAEATKGLLDDHLRMLIGLTSVQQREWLFLRAGDETKAADTLMISIDRVFDMAINSDRMVFAGGLAARFLSVGNIRGWDEANKTRLWRARLLKATARIAGCIVQGEAAVRDFSDEYKKFNSQDQIFLDESDEYVSLFRGLPNQSPNTKQCIQPNPHDLSQADYDLVRVANALSMPFNLENTGDRLNVLKVAVICLTSEKGNQENLVKLLDVNHHAFRAFVDASLIGGVAALFARLLDRNKFHESALNNIQNIVKFAELLLYWLERPYMADMKARAGWQEQLWRVYLALNDSDRQQLSLDDKLLIYAAVSHVTAAAMRGLHESCADQLEKTIYEEWDSSNLPIYNAGARADLRVSQNDLWNILNRYENWGRCEMAFVQLVLTPDGRDLMLLVAKRSGNDVTYRESIVGFAPYRHQGISYNSWKDLWSQVGKHTYFENETGDLKELDRSPLGQPSIRILWLRIAELIVDVGFEEMPKHLCLCPDPALASIPWQLVAMKIAQGKDFPLITLVHGLRWIYLSSHEVEGMYREAGAPRRVHERGIFAWIAPTETPRAGLDLRDEIKEQFFGADNNRPALTNRPGVSLSVVFGHGAIRKSESITSVEAIEDSEEWNYVRSSRICVLLSCETGAGIPGALGDYLSLSHKLCRTSKALVLPPVKVSHMATQALSKVFYEAINESLLGGGSCWIVQEVYQEAIRQHPGVALFSLWGLGYEPIVWVSQVAKRPATA